MDAILGPLKTATTAEQQAQSRPTREQAEEAVRTLIAWAGDDPTREGVIDTPKRVVKAYEEFYRGYDENVRDVLARTFEDVGGYDDIIIVRDIPFYSHCEHHMVPFTGKAHIGYYPVEGVVGLSKLARVTDIFARRMQTQENLTAQISDAIDDVLQPRGVAVFLEAEHMCMSLRGVQKHGVSTITTQYKGVFQDDPNEQTRFLAMVRGRLG